MGVQLGGGETTLLAVLTRGDGGAELVTAPPAGRAPAVQGGRAEAGWP